MELAHSFVVPAGPEPTWAVLTDVARVARCLPGAQLDEASADPYTGTVKIKVGAVVVQLRGSMTFAEVDASTGHLVMICEGADPRGGSGARAQISIQLTAADAGRTTVAVTTALQLSGKIAQFGQAMLQDVSNAILGKFVANLERELTAPAGSAGPGAAPAPDEAIDLGAAVLPVIARRYGAPLLGALSLLIALAALVRSLATDRPRRTYR